MLKIKSVGFKIIATAIFGLSLIGCGGGGGSSGGDTPAVTNTGTFVDSPVEGLKYETATLSGYTNDQGEFNYKTNESVTFTLGNLVIGKTSGNTLITPANLLDVNTSNAISQTKKENIARILQTLDNNSSNGAKLLIPSSLNSLDISYIDLESEADLNTLLTRVQEKRRPKNGGDSME